MRCFTIAILLVVCTMLPSALAADGDLFTATQPTTGPAEVDLSKNALVQKALADKDKAIQDADAEYSKKLDALNAEHKKKVDAANVVCVTALHRAESVSKTLKKDDEATIKALADSIQNEVNAPTSTKPATPKHWPQECVGKWRRGTGFTITLNANGTAEQKDGAGHWWVNGNNQVEILWDNYPNKGGILRDVWTNHAGKNWSRKVYEGDKIKYDNDINQP